ncbi:MAG: sigma-70 family RNA polymerase sigma factor [Gammaproteobacteria bacterium]|nr:sigma-70 family RNA polymerase sigma factor [Gammaproteobacteria bacterium]
MANDKQGQRQSPAPASDRTDAELLTRSIGGDRDAFHALYVRFYHPVLRFVYRVTGQLELAQEAVNDVMLIVWRDGRSFAGRSSVSTWIMGIAYRIALKASERSRRWSRRYAAAEFDAAAERLASSQEHTADTEMRDLIEHGLDLLSPEQRAVVELTYYFGCSYEEIAQIVGCPENTVKTRMFHARAKLRTVLPRLGRDDAAR